MSLVRVRYYTDPACPWSWALEPALRHLTVEFAECLRIEYVMAGMRAAFSDPKQFAGHALDAGEQSGMPVDVRWWLEDPLKDSHGACMAVKAAGEQGDPAPYLRRLREGLLCRGRRLDTAQALIAEARPVPGLDLERFRIDLSSHGVLERLGGDLELARGVHEEHQSPEEARVKLPSLEFQGQSGGIEGVYGFSSYDELRAAALRAGAEPNPQAMSVEQALRRFPTLSTAEVRALCGLPGPTAPATLWRLATEWRVKPEHVGTGVLWSAAG